MKSDRRPRLPANDIVLLGSEEEPAWVVNWSGNGFCVITENVLRTGDRVRVDLPERYMRGEATVVWIKQHQDGCLAGLEFTEVDRRVIRRN